MGTDLSETIYDVAIIGGGIAGAGIARDAAMRGLHVIVFEKNTVGSGTSSKSSKLIHGGIRYLETAWHALKRGQFQESVKNFRFVFVSLKECRILEKIAPDLIKPLPLVIPIYKNKKKNPWTIYAGSALYYLLARLGGTLKAPQFLWTKKSILKLIPSLDEKNLLGGVVLWDHCTDDKALVQKTMLSAKRHRTQLHEQTEVVSYEFNPKKNVYEIEVRENNLPTLYYARKLVNASGPWVDKVRVRSTDKTVVDNFLLPVAGSHITFKKFIPLSTILQAEDGRIFFVINLGETSRVGTTEHFQEDPDKLDTTEEEIDYLLSSLKKYFPTIPFKKDEILSKDSGIRPLAHPGKTVFSIHEVSREHEIRRSADGVLHILGVKLTDHRRAAEEIVNVISCELKNSRRVETHKTPL